MVVKIKIFSNLDVICYDENNSITHQFKVLDTLMNKLKTEGIVTENTEIWTPLSHQPTPVKDWFKLKEDENAEKE
jgi:hypothetical protein